MIEFSTYASGSSGNLYRISDGSASLLIECGIPIREIRKRLNFELSNISGCLVSHGHFDHCIAVLDMMKAGIDCYMTAGAYEPLGLSGHRLKTIKAGVQVQIGPFTVMPFATEHDAAEPVGFLIQSGADKLLYLTDSYYCRYRFSGLNMIAVECNYHLPILQANLAAGIVPMALKNRILKSHFSLDNVKEFLKANDLSQVREIHLIYLSETNSDVDLFKTKIERLTRKPTYIS